MDDIIKECEKKGGTLRLNFISSVERDIKVVDGVWYLPMVVYIVHPVPPLPPPSPQEENTEKNKTPFTVFTDDDGSKYDIFINRKLD